VDHTVLRGKGSQDNGHSSTAPDLLGGQGHQRGYYTATNTEIPVQQAKSASHHVHFSTLGASHHPIRMQENSHMSMNCHLNNNRSVSNFASSTAEMMQGFDCVREALLKTSKAIHDIDDILDKKK
jgi:hypothetical protein